MQMLNVILIYHLRLMPWMVCWRSLWIFVLNVLLNELYCLLIPQLISPTSLDVMLDFICDLGLEYYIGLHWGLRLWISYLTSLGIQVANVTFNHFECYVWLHWGYMPWMKCWSSFVIDAFIFLWGRSLCATNGLGGVGVV